MVESQVADHAFIKISRPSQDPLNNEMPEAKDLSQSKMIKKSQVDKKKYKAKLIKESFGDKFVVEAGKKFSKTWTF